MNHETGFGECLKNVSKQKMSKVPFSGPPCAPSPFSSYIVILRSCNPKNPEHARNITLSKHLFPSTLRTIRFFSCFDFYFLPVFWSSKANFAEQKSSAKFSRSKFSISLKQTEVVNCPEGNHNWFRISRVLVSLRLLGLIDEAGQVNLISLAVVCDSSRSWPKKTIQLQFWIFWAIYNDLSRGHPKCGLVRESLPKWP